MPKKRHLTKTGRTTLCGKAIRKQGVIIDEFEPSCAACTERADSPHLSSNTSSFEDSIRVMLLNTYQEGYKAGLTTAEKILVDLADKLDKK